MSGLLLHFFSTDCTQTSSCRRATPKGVHIFGDRHQNAIDQLALSWYYIRIALEPVGYGKRGLCMFEATTLALLTFSLLNRETPRWVDIFVPRHRNAIDVLALPLYYISMASEPVRYRERGLCMVEAPETAVSNSQHLVWKRTNESISSERKVIWPSHHLHRLSIINAELWSLFDIGKGGSAGSRQQHWWLWDFRQVIKTEYQNSPYLRT